MAERITGHTELIGLMAYPIRHSSSPAAELCGAVNTIVNDNGHLTGHITDGIGFMSALKDNDIDVIGKKMTIVGAGGAATAIEIQAALDGVAEITIFNRKDDRRTNADRAYERDPSHLL